MAAGGQYLEISNDSRVYFSEDNPQLIAFETLEATYSEANTVMSVVSSKYTDSPSNIFTENN